MEDFASMLEASFNEGFDTLHNGDIVEGTILEIQTDDVVVDIHSYMDGILPISELIYEDEVLDLLYHVGDKIKVMVTRVDTRESTIYLSKLRADQIVIWDELEECRTENRSITFQVKEVVKGGLRIQYKGIRGFLPQYQITNQQGPEAEQLLEHPEVLVGKGLTGLVTRVDPERRDVVVSVKEYERRQQQVARTEFMRTVAEGETFVGTVTRVEPYGAFVEISPGVEGLIHVSELAWTRVKHPSEVVNVGDQVKVTVLSVDPERGRIGLRLKDLNQDPWANMSYVKDQQIDNCVVRKIIATGAFVSLKDGLEAFLPISQISEKRLRTVQEVLKEGDTVSVKILSVDPKARRISVTMRGLDIPAEEDFGSYTNNDESEGYSLADTFKGFLS